LEEGCLVPDDGGDFIGRDADVEVVPSFEGGLGGGAEDGGGVEVEDEATQGSENGMEERGGKGLNFVEDEDAAGDPVELAAGASAVGEKGFKKLDVGGDNEGSIPIFGGEAVVLGFFGGIEFGVVFEDNISTEFAGKVGKDCAKDVGVLLDDAREWDDEDEAALPVFYGVAQGEKK